MSYSASKKLKLLKSYDETAEIIQDYLTNRYEKELANRLYREVRQEYQELIPEIPCIEGLRACALNSFLLITAQELAVYRVMEKLQAKHGKYAMRQLAEEWKSSLYLKSNS